MFLDPLTLDNGKRIVKREWAKHRMDGWMGWMDNDGQG